MFVTSRPADQALNLSQDRGAVRPLGGGAKAGGMDGSRLLAYRRGMTRGTLRIRAIALVVAYALALQGLLLAFVPPAMALPGELCSGETADSPAAPAGHNASCASACVLLGAAAAPPPPNSVVAVRIAARISNFVPHPAPLIAVPQGPQTARAPPIV